MACQFSVPSHSAGFSYLGVPALAGMSDYYESMSQTAIRDSLPTRHSGPQTRHSSESWNPEGRGAGIDK